ncbi:nucleoside triphosphate hydrolase [Hydrogenophaga sp.]|uniref:nucleoside triphosphate hydrolase n=1 Tax=Hydrogenophaga sp. TaxID=1904254 RepID=UPI001ACA2A24|nr:nucleoside triphosphate hydrolase [Hydrogenophaga sp.]MBN9372137.1 nucleoside triphosphate hydrolase [Hydrogenophaga sp.]
MNVLSFFRKPHSAQTQQTSSKPACVAEPGDITFPRGGWAPAGYDIDGSYIVLSRKTGQLTTLRAQDLEEKKLLLKLGPAITEIYRTVNPETLVPTFDSTELIKEIRTQCDAMGLFDKRRVRGPGLYRAGDELIVNFGNQVATSKGIPVQTAPDSTGASYQSGPDLGFSMHTPTASEEEVKQLVDALQSFGLRHSSDAKLLLGWLAMAFYGPVLSHRPILAITAERGAGKTTLLELFAQLLGPQAIRRDGVPTVPQIIYELEHRPAALLVDELEARKSKQVAVENLLEALRIGFSNSSGHRVSRIIGGKKRYFNAPAGVLLAGIGLPAFNPATESRTVRICLNTLEQAAEGKYQPLFDSAREEDVAALGARLRRLLLTRWSVMRDSLRTVRSMLIALGHEPRAADKYAPLVAGYVAFVSDVELSVETLRALLDDMQLMKPEKQVVERDADVLMRILLDRKVAVFVPREGHSPLKLHLPIREVVQAVIHGPDEARKPLTMQLEEFGLRPIWRAGDGQWKLAVCTSEHHAGMRRLMQRTDWALGGWKDVLLRMAGSKSDVQKIAKQSQRVALMDMPAELMEVPDEGAYEFPGQASVAPL